MMYDYYQVIVTMLLVSSTVTGQVCDPKFDATVYSGDIVIGQVKIISSLIVSVFISIEQSSLLLCQCSSLLSSLLFDCVSVHLY